MGIADLVVWKYLFRSADQITLSFCLPSMLILNRVLHYYELCIFFRRLDHFILRVFGSNHSSVFLILSASVRKCIFQETLVVDMQHRYVLNVLACTGE